MLLPKIYEIEEILRKKNKSIDKLSCCILRNISVENIELYLKYYLSLDNKNLAIDFGNYDIRPILNFETAVKSLSDN